MALSSGTRLGVYEVIASIGIGGMGEVYRARDTRLGRDVALKILPDSFTNDPERITRFRREAQLLAALNHPHIGAIYGLDDANGRQLLVLELVDGESLDARIARAPGALEEVVVIARQIAEALEAAHEKGIIHRDLKPANIALTRNGTVKVLDFGLAKSMDAAETGAPDTRNSPTITSPATMTGMGVILGTAAYMSPEQAKGLPADHRSDVFSFGVVVYELLTGRRAFHGETIADVLASVLVREPNLSAIPSDVHPRMLDLLRRCLEKSPRKRWQAMGDVRLELEAIEAAPRLPPATARTAASRRTHIWQPVGVVMAALLAGGAISTAWWYGRPRPRVPVTRFSVGLGSGLQFPFAARQMLAISQDGEQLVFSATSTRQSGDVVSTVYLHRMTDFDSRPIPGVEGGSPVFSPDGSRVAFYTANTRGSHVAVIKTIPVTGGEASTVCAVPAVPAGLSWSGNDLVFSDGTSIKRVPAGGGEPQELLHLSAGEAAYGHKFCRMAASCLLSRPDRAVIDGRGPRSSPNRSPRTSARLC